MTVTVTLTFSDAAAAVQSLARMLSGPAIGHANATEVRERVAEQFEAAGIDPRPVVSISTDDAIAPTPAPVEVAKLKRGRKSNAEKAAAVAAQAPAPAALTNPAPTQPTAYPTVEQVIAKGREVYEKLGPQKGLTQCNALLARYGVQRFSAISTAMSQKFMEDADRCLKGTDFTAVVD